MPTLVLNGNFWAETCLQQQTEDKRRFCLPKMRCLFIRAVASCPTLCWSSTVRQARNNPEAYSGVWSRPGTSSGSHPRKTAAEPAAARHDHPAGRRRGRGHWYGQPPPRTACPQLGEETTDISTTPASGVTRHGDGKGIDPAAPATLVVSIPSAAVDLSDRIRNPDAPVNPSIMPSIWPDSR
jgi:hypothetical protein